MKRSLLLLTALVNSALGQNWEARDITWNKYDTSPPFLFFRLYMSTEPNNASAPHVDLSKEIGQQILFNHKGTYIYLTAVGSALPNTDGNVKPVESDPSNELYYEIKTWVEPTPTPTPTPSATPYNSVVVVDNYHPIQYSTIQVTIKGAMGNLGDKLELWKGSTFVDWVYFNGTKTPPVINQTDCVVLFKLKGPGTFRIRYTNFGVIQSYTNFIFVRIKP